MIFEIKLSRSINFDDPIFDSIRKNYNNFDTWSKRMNKVNRPCIVLENKNTNEYECIAILKPCESHRVLKICTFKVAEKYRRKHLGSQMIKWIKSIVNDDFQPFDKCYITLFLTSDTAFMPEFLERNEFTLTNIRSNGELVYTYERSI